MFLSEKRKKRDMILKRVLKMEVYNIILKIVFGVLLVEMPRGLK